MMTNKRSVEQSVRDIRRRTRKKYSAEEKIRIVLEGLRGEGSIAELCRREGINSNVYYRWSKDFLEAGKKRLSGDTVREATSDEVKELRAETAALKETLGEAVIELALEQPDLSPRELAVTYTDKHAYFISESTVYRLLKEQDLITSPAYILMEASDVFQQPTTRVNQMWQTDFTYFKIIGWGWYYLSTVLDDYSRYIIAWRLCTGMSANDVSVTLDDALRFTGLDEVKVNHNRAYSVIMALVISRVN